MDNKEKKIKELCKYIYGKEDLIPLLRELITPLDGSKVNDGILMTLFAIVSPMVNYNGPFNFYNQSDLIIGGVTIQVNYDKPGVELIIESEDRLVEFEIYEGEVSGLVCKKDHERDEYGDYFFDATYWDNGLLKYSKYSVYTIPIKLPYKTSKSSDENINRQEISFDYRTNNIIVNSVNNKEVIIYYDGLTSRVVPYIPFVTDSDKQKFDSILGEYFPSLYRIVGNGIEKIIEDLLWSIKGDEEPSVERGKECDYYRCELGGHQIYLVEMKDGSYEGNGYIDDKYTPCHIKVEEKGDHDIVLVHSETKDRDKMRCGLKPNYGSIKLDVELVKDDNPRIEIDFDASFPRTRSVISLNENSNEEVMNKLYNIIVSPELDGITTYVNEIWHMVEPEIRQCLDKYALERGRQKSMGEKKS